MTLYQLLILKTSGEILSYINLSKEAIDPQKSGEFIREAYIFAEETMRHKLRKIKADDRLFIVTEIKNNILLAIMTDESEYETVELNAEKIVDFLYDYIRDLDSASIKKILSAPEIQQKILEILKSKPRYFF